MIKIKIKSVQQGKLKKEEELSEFREIIALEPYLGLRKTDAYVNGFRYNLQKGSTMSAN